MCAGDLNSGSHDSQQSQLPVSTVAIESSPQPNTNILLFCSIRKVFPPLQGLKVGHSAWLLFSCNSPISLEMPFLTCHINLSPQVIATSVSGTGATLWYSCSLGVSTLVSCSTRREVLCEHACLLCRVSTLQTGYKFLVSGFIDLLNGRREQASKVFFQ